MNPNRILAAIGVASLLLAPNIAQAASCYIREYTAIGGTSVQVAAEPGVDQTPVTLTGSTAPSAAFQTTTHVVRLFCGAGASFVFGATPTATTSGAPLAALTPEYFWVVPGQKVAFISNATP